MHGNSRKRNGYSTKPIDGLSVVVGEIVQRNLVRCFPTVFFRTTNVLNLRGTRRIAVCGN